MSKAQIERFKTQPPSNLGKTFTKEIVEKGRLVRLKYYQTHEINNKGKSHSEATRKKISKAMKKFWSIPENKERMIKVHLDRYF